MAGSRAMGLEPLDVALGQPCTERCRPDLGASPVDEQEGRLAAHAVCGNDTAPLELLAVTLPDNAGTHGHGTGGGLAASRTRGQGGR